MIDPCFIYIIYICIFVFEDCNRLIHLPILSRSAPLHITSDCRSLCHISLYPWSPCIVKPEPCPRFLRPLPPGSFQTTFPAQQHVSAHSFDDQKQQCCMNKNSPTCRVCSIDTTYLVPNSITNGGRIAHECNHPLASLLKAKIILETCLDNVRKNLEVRSFHRGLFGPRHLCFDPEATMAL